MILGPSRSSVGCPLSQAVSYCWRLFPRRWPGPRRDCYGVTPRAEPRRRTPPRRRLRPRLRHRRRAIPVPSGRSHRGIAGNRGCAAIGPGPSQRTSLDVDPPLGLLRLGQHREDSGLLAPPWPNASGSAARCSTMSTCSSRSGIGPSACTCTSSGPATQRPRGALRRGAERREHVGPWRGHEEHHVRHRQAAARRTDRHAEPVLPLDRVGHPQMTRRLVEVGEKDVKYGECEVKYYKGAKINNRVCTCIEVMHPVPGGTSFSTWPASSSTRTSICRSATSRTIGRMKKAPRPN